MRPINPYFCDMVNWPSTVQILCRQLRKRMKALPYTEDIFHISTSIFSFFQQQYPFLSTKKSLEKPTQTQGVSWTCQLEGTGTGRPPAPCSQTNVTLFKSRVVCLCDRQSWRPPSWETDYQEVEASNRLSVANTGRFTYLSEWPTHKL